MYSLSLVAFIIFLGQSIYASPNEEWDDPQTVKFDPDTDVRFFLYTRQNPKDPQELNYNNIETIRQSHYNKSKGVRFTVHGFLGEGDGNYNLRVVDAYLANSDLNVIAVDWGAGAQTINYIAARNRVGPVGGSISKLLDFLYDNGELDFNLVTLTGISLGAHVVGMAGKQTSKGKVAAIIGLDPAGPLFRLSNKAERLNAGDGKYVEVIHTNGGILGMGLETAIGDADFYVNGGYKQPGCIAAYCSHARAAYLFTESLDSPNNFVARRCNNQQEAENGKCSGESGTFMGGEPSNAGHNLSGIFHLNTNDKSPFGLGEL